MQTSGPYALLMLVLRCIERLEELQVFEEACEDLMPIIQHYADESGDIDKDGT